MKLSKVEKTKLRTWVELDKNAIKYNYETFKRIIRRKNKKYPILMAVVKSNAYGHGLIYFSKELVKLGVKFFGVDSLEEALDLRKEGIKTNILVFGYVSPYYFQEAMNRNISITISNIATLKYLLKMKKNSTVGEQIKIHIKVDTGFGRQGFSMDQIEEVLNILKKIVKNKNIKVEGLYSHLAVGEDILGKKYTMLQAERLSKWEDEFKKIGLKPLKHICATSSTMFFPELHFDMVRVGIGMYGLWPSKNTKKLMRKKYTLYPVLSWKTIITEIKSFPKGVKIGYDLTEELKRKSKLAVIPVGYWHGYPRILSRKGIFNVAGKKVKLIGSVCMDMIVLDITNIPAKIGDEVAIIGGDYGHYAEVDMMAQDSDTINYEITTRINPIIKRFYRINPLIRRLMK